MFSYRSFAEQYWVTNTMLLMSDWWDEALGGLVTLCPDHTGLPFWIWCWCAPADPVVQVVVTRAPSRANGEWSTIAVHPDLQHVDGEPLSGRDLDQLAHWMRWNGALVARYWRQDVMFTAEF
jgi:hypothetical protein